jgi:D-glutamate cyclase
MPDRNTGSEVAELVDDCVGENLDQLMTLDMRGDGISRALAAAARAQTDGPLALTAARRLREALYEGGSALFLTGFVVPPWGIGETDGLIGTVVLARALERAFATRIVVVSEEDVLPALEAGFREAGLLVYRKLEAANRGRSVCLIPFPKDEAVAAAEAARLAEEVAPAACVAIERPGKNAVGQYHYALGKNVTEWVAPVDLLYEAVAGRNALTVAVGDFGNELGMGAIAPAVIAETPAGADCGCPCQGGIACPIPADVTVASSVSDWGAYATAAALSYLQGEPAVFTTPCEYKAVLRATVRGGCIDGASHYAIPAIDGVAEETNVALVALLRDAVAYPAAGARFQSIREFRALRARKGVREWT